MKTRNSMRIKAEGACSCSTQGLAFFCLLINIVFSMMTYLGCSPPQLIWTSPPTTGYVIHQEDDEFLVDFGRHNEVKKGDALLVFRVVSEIYHPVTGELVRVQLAPVGIIRLEEIREISSSGKLLQGSGNIQSGDMVRIISSRHIPTEPWWEEALWWKQMKHTLSATVFSQTPSIATTHGTQVQFLDSSLEAAIREALKQPNAPITRTSLATLTRLEVQGQNISDLSGLEYCVSLTELELSHNHRIKDITPLSNLRKLRRIELNHNQIDDLAPLRGLTRLEVIGLASNRVTDLRPISSLTNLKLLRLADNQVVDITPLSKLTRLEWLDIAGNQIVDIQPLVDLKRLAWLRLTSNPIRNYELLDNIKRRGTRVTQE